MLQRGNIVSYFFINQTVTIKYVIKKTSIDNGNPVSPRTVIYPPRSQKNKNCKKNVMRKIQVIFQALCVFMVAIIQLITDPIARISPKHTTTI